MPYFLCVAGGCGCCGNYFSRPPPAARHCSRRHCPGGFGTMDEMFETLTLIQTGRMKQVPFLLFGQEFWEEVINWRALAKAGTISVEDLDLFRFVETAEDAIRAMDTWDGAGEKREKIPGR